VKPILLPKVEKRAKAAHGRACVFIQLQDANLPHRRRPQLPRTLCGRLSHTTLPILNTSCRKSTKSFSLSCDIVPTRFTTPNSPQQRSAWLRSSGCPCPHPHRASPIPYSNLYRPHIPHKGRVSRSTRHDEGRSAAGVMAQRERTHILSPLRAPRQGTTGDGGW
jgi:hypothetical protein